VSIGALRDSVRTVDPEPIAELTMRMLEIWSPPGREAEMAALALEALIEAGAEDVALDAEFPESPSVIAWLRSGHPGPTLQWHGHLDAIRSAHAAPRREGDVLYGRGASDMKGALAAEIEAVKLLRAAGLPERGDVLITFHGLHEEGRSAPLRRLNERGIHGDAALIGELGSETELITSGRGLSFWEFSVGRSGQPVHEQNAPPGTVHPIRAASVLLNRLLELADDLAAGRITPSGSLFIGEFQAGDYFNRVPSHARLAGTRRHHADRTLDEVREQLIALGAAVAAETGATVDAAIQSIAEAYEIQPDARIARALRRANFELTGRTMAAVQSRAVGNASDFVRGAGIPAVYYGCDYASAHSNEERVSLADLARVAGAYALTTALFLDAGEIDAPALAPPPTPPPTPTPTPTA
jgi:acetylornithine deacetylase/succinyl-diaminopimelate desuccinylase-like protein